jgi:antibiotic biosynthesis monooxygenase (ABM) superfamily enzyme
MMPAGPAVKREREMHAVIFEFRVNPDREEDYFAWAEKLSGEVRKADGFLGIERF